MCRHSITRRQMLGMGLGAAAGMVVVPNVLSALGAGAPPPTDLEVAVKAAKWIRRSRVETKNGVTWPADPLKPDSIGMDLYNGMPGVILFHLELFDATGDRAWLEDARLAANELTAQLPALQAAQASGLYEGLAGAAFVLEETHRATGEGKYRDAARRAIAMIHGLAKKTEAGVEWSGASAANDIISGAAGIGLFLLWADRTMDDPQSRTLALAAGRQLVEVGIKANGGTKWAVSPSVKSLYPNFSHGTAGVAFFLTKLYRATTDVSMYAAALSAARYLQAVANADGGGYKVFHHEPGGEGLYYLSWCHGPAGTSRLFHQLAQTTSGDKWQALVDRGAQATIAAGVPEKQSPGYWNNISQCCGNCGVGEFFITLQQTAPKPQYADMVRRISADTLARATIDGDGLKWIQAENRVSPQAVVAQTGFMQGAAGVGTYFLHADALAKARRRSIVWPDSSLPQPCSAKEKTSRDMSDLVGGVQKSC